MLGLPCAEGKYLDPKFENPKPNIYSLNPRPYTQLPGETKGETANRIQVAAKQAQEKEEHRMRRHDTRRSRNTLYIPLGGGRPRGDGLEKIEGDSDVQREHCG